MFGVWVLACSARIGVDSGPEAVQIKPTGQPWVLSKHGYGADLKKQHQGRIQGRVTPPSFHPPFVEFDKQPLCHAKKEDVVVVNADPRHDLTLFSLESWSDDFHCTWPETEVVPPGKNTTFSIVYLGHSLGRVEASVMLNTSHGDLSYEVFADSSVHSMGVHPLINGRVPVNTTYIQPLVLHNPHGVLVQVLEIFSSTDKLQLELSGDADDESEPLKPQFSWLVQPYESKVVVYVHATIFEPTVIEGYINIRTNMTEANAIVTVKVEISDQIGLYFGPEEDVDFGTVTVTDPQLAMPVKVLSNTDDLIHVIGASVNLCQHVDGSPCRKAGSARDSLPVHLTLKKVTGVMKPNKFAAIGDLVLTPDRSLTAGLYFGEASVHYRLNSSRKALKIKFRYEVSEGYLDYMMPLQSVFYSSATAAKKKGDRKVDTRQVTIISHYPFDVYVSAVTMPTEATERFKVLDFSPFVLQPHSTKNVTVQYDPRASLVSSPVMRTELMVWNDAVGASLKVFTIPVYAHDGRLKYILDGNWFNNTTDQLLTVDFGTMVLDDVAKKHIILANFNPVQIGIRLVSNELSTCSLKLLSVDPVRNYPELLTIADGSKPPQSSRNNSRGLRPSTKQKDLVVIKPGHYANFSLEVKAVAENLVQGSVTLMTRYETYSLSVSYTGSRRTAKITPLELNFSAALPGRPLRNPRSDDTGQKGGFLELESKDETRTLYVIPEARGAQVTKITSKDPRFVVKPAAILEKDGWKTSDDKVPLATVSFKPSFGPGGSNYVPFLADNHRNQLPPLTQSNLREVDRTDRVWRRLKKKKQTSIKSSIIIESSSSEVHEIPVTASLSPLKISTVNAVEFPLTQLRQASEQEFVVKNPTDYPVRVGLELVDVYGDSSVMPTLSSLFDLSSEDLRQANLSQKLFTITPTSHKDVIWDCEPHGVLKYVLKYRPEIAGVAKTTLLVRSNLSIVEQVILSGEAGRGTFGFPKSQPTIVDGGLYFKVEAKDLGYCLGEHGMQLEDANKEFTYNVTIVNRGNMPVSVSRMTVNGLNCSLHGFTIRHCSPFVLKPKKPHILTVDFRPDFTSSVVKHKLVVQLEGSSRPLNFLMQAILPEDMARICASALPIQEFEWRLKWAVVAVALVVTLLIYIQELASGTWSKKPKVSSKKKLTKDHAKGDAVEVPEVPQADANTISGSGGDAKSKRVVIKETKKKKNGSSKEKLPSSVQDASADGVAGSGSNLGSFTSTKSASQGNEFKSSQAKESKAKAVAVEPKAKESVKVRKATHEPAAPTKAPKSRRDAPIIAKGSAAVDVRRAESGGAESEHGGEAKTRAAGGSKKPLQFEEPKIPVRVDVASRPTVSRDESVSRKKVSGGMPPVGDAEKLVAAAKAAAEALTKSKPRTVPPRSVVGSGLDSGTLSDASSESSVLGMPSSTVNGQASIAQATISDSAFQVPIPWSAAPTMSVPYNNLTSSVSQRSVSSPLSSPPKRLSNSRPPPGLPTGPAPSIPPGFPPTPDSSGASWLGQDIPPLPPISTGPENGNGSSWQSTYTGGPATGTPASTWESVPTWSIPASASNPEGDFANGIFQPPQGADKIDIEKELSTFNHQNLEASAAGISDPWSSGQNETYAIPSRSSGVEPIGPRRDNSASVNSVPYLPAIPSSADSGNIWGGISGLGELGDLDWANKPDADQELNPNASSWSSKW